MKRRWDDVRSTEKVPLLEGINQRAFAADSRIKKVTVTFADQTGVIMVVYFGVLRDFEAIKVIVILLFSLVGIAGSAGVAWFGIRVNTFANSRAAFASLRGKPFPTYAIPLKAGMSIGTMLISVEGSSGL